MTPAKSVLIEGFLHDGVLEGLHPHLAEAIKDWPNGPIEIEIRAQEQSRRARANNYYRAVILKLIAEEMGQTPDEVHDIMKLRHNAKFVTDPATGEEFRVGASTKDLTIKEFSAYLEAVMLDGNEHLGITFPPPRQREAWVDPMPVETKVDL